MLRGAGASTVERRLPVKRRVVPDPFSSTFRTPRRVLFAFAMALSLATAPGEAHAVGAPPSPTPGVELVETTFKSVDATVSAQWEFPARTPAPLVVLLPASQAVDRNGLPPGYGEDPATGIYAQLARKLLDAGFAVFRYDPPGTGRSSPGSFTTERATALEGYTRAVDHPKVDRDHVFLLGHSASTDTIVGIYPRYAAACRPAGLILLASIVGETDIVRAEAPVLLVVTDKTPDEIYRHGQFPTDARARSTSPKLETSLVLLPGAEETLLSEVEKPNGGKLYSIDPRAVEATIEWIRGRLGLPTKT
jgi:pimeloyl-ACP methyl ester carboxylesterase